MRARPVGDRGLLVECADTTEVERTYAALRAAADLLAATDIVPAARTVLVDGVADLPAALETVRALDLVREGPLAGDGPLVEIPVRYDGPDLAEVARQWRVGPAEVVRVHTSIEFVVAFCGFAPGFAYCAGLPEGRDVRRRAEPRPRVPPGSVALAGEFTGVYPSASPGGWQLIGTTTTAVWRPDLDDPALLSPGTRVRFREVTSSPEASDG